MKFTEELILTDANFEAELRRCEYCEEQPCRTGCLESEESCKSGCPANVSPAEFIMAARGGKPSDIQRSAALIMTANPFGGVCGMVCPDTHCMATCVHDNLDCPINIPALQATIIHKARELGVMPKLEKSSSNGKKVAVIGAGAAGLAGAALLGLKGYQVDIFEKASWAGGVIRCIPPYRLREDVLDSDIEFCLAQGDITLKTDSEVEDLAALLSQGYGAVLVSTGLWEAIKPGIPNQDLAITSLDFLSDPDKFDVQGTRVAIIGGGAVAADCAVMAKEYGAAYVDMFALETAGEMPLTGDELVELLEECVDINGRTAVEEIVAEDGKITGLRTTKVNLPADEAFSLKAICPIEGCGQERFGIDRVILAIGNRSAVEKIENPAVFYAGDVALGPVTVVEAVASGKNAAQEIDALISGAEKPVIADPGKSEAILPGYNFRPVSLETDFFGRKLINPFLLSAAPPSDGFDQMEKALQAGWAGGIMKTAFAPGTEIHIPAAYMYQNDPLTFANCDNVSGHRLDRVCPEVERLVKAYPDRLIGASTGGDVSGNDESDMKSWQSNTKMLENAGAMVIEYSLSCPQGGEGAEGDIVSQNAPLTAKIIDWILQVGDPDIPKLFKLTPAVTEITTIINAIKEVFARYPDSKAGVTLGNTFPSLDFRNMGKEEWEDGAVVGISGAAVAPINYLTLAKVGNLDVHVSGNGGPMDYMAAANFLALGVKTVQFCTIVEKYGYGIIDELCSGLSHLMAARGIKSVSDLIGIALPEPIRDFMDLTPIKQISTVDEDLCVHCGNCTRCPYQALTLNDKKVPETDAELCIGCGMCGFLCPAGALSLRDRDEEETKALKED
jgi:NADPH-dependent glutamate synthase beta subunit-like oxidoreductase/dihydroorotate dehydrogenase/Pyruvate/2-oxoacid:ferredoxin oxidoreductase delta subunit